MASAIFLSEGTMNATRLLKCCAAIALIWSASAASSDGADRSVWPVTPYQVQVYVALAPQPPLTARLEATLIDDLGLRIDATVGSPWNAKVSAAPAPLRRQMLHGIDSLTAGQLPLTSPEPDKILLISVTAADGCMTVSACDFDVRTRTLSPPVSRPVWQTGVLCDAALDAMLTAFAPLARIESVSKDGKELVAVMRVKASGLPPRDPRLTFLHRGDVFRPIVRINDRGGVFRSSAPARWSLCAVEQISPEEVRCSVYSGLRGEMAVRGRGRNESLALRVVPPEGDAATVLTLRSRTDPKKPLAGYDVYAYPAEKKDQRDKGPKDAATLLGQTDRRGCITVLPDKSPIRMLLVKDGDELLARLPMSPGLERHQTAEIADDDLRLEAEGFYRDVQEEFFDQIAREKILMQRIRAKIESKDFDKASELLIELRRLPADEDFLPRIDRDREKFAVKDAAVQKKVNAIADNARQLIGKNIKPDSIRDLEQELREAKEHEEKPVKSSKTGS
jgi:hypothetical protein